MYKYLVTKIFHTVYNNQSTISKNNFNSFTDNSLFPLRKHAHAIYRDF